MGIRFCLGVAMDSDVVSDSNTSLAFLKDLIHLLLEDVLETDQGKGKSQEVVSSEETVEGHKQSRILVEDD